MRQAFDLFFEPLRVQRLDRCGIGSWGGQSLSMADYVAGTAPRGAADAAGGC